MENEDTFFKIEFFVTFVVIIIVMILERVANRSNTKKTESNILNHNSTKNIEKTHYLKILYLQLLNTTKIFL